MRHKCILVLPALIASLAGCNSPEPINPTFPLTVDQANEALDAMRMDPKPLARPVVFLDAYLDPGYTTQYIRAQVSKVTTHGVLIDVNFLDCGTFDECRRKVIDAVNHKLSMHNPQSTIEVDVIGASMGGLVGRYAAMPAPGGRQLRVARLFTIASPHRGAQSAGPLILAGLASHMRPDSPFIQQINSLPIGRNYELYPYVWLADDIVGAANAAPPGQNPWWLAGLPLQQQHVGSMRDPRIAADIARRLRYEIPYTTFPPAPLPMAMP